MPSVDVLREFVNERLTAAAEEIFRVFQRTVVEYEEEIDRQRRLLDAVWKPAVKLHRIELPQHYGRKEGDQVGNSSLDQKDPEPPRVKEEHEELCTTQDGAQLVLKLETATFMLTPHHEGSGHSNLNPEVSAAQTESVAAEPKSDQQLLSHNSHGAESQDQKGGQHEDSGSSGDSDPEPNNQQHNSKTNHVNKPTMLKSHRNPHTGKKSFRCDTCGKYSKHMSEWQRHMRMHTGEKPYSCDECGKRFTQTSSLNVHRRVHTGEKPHVCKICGNGFRHSYVLLVHMRMHTGERPYICQTCGRGFIDKTKLTIHMRRAHTGEKPYPCKTCGKSFAVLMEMRRHMRIHTGEMPYSCQTCGRHFRCHSNLASHRKNAHSDEVPYICENCHKTFLTNSQFRKHVRACNCKQRWVLPRTSRYDTYHDT